MEIGKWPQSELSNKRKSCHRSNSELSKGLCNDILDANTSGTKCDDGTCDRIGFIVIVIHLQISTLFRIVDEFHSAANFQTFLPTSQLLGIVFENKTE